MTPVCDTGKKIVGDKLHIAVDTGTRRQSPSWQTFKRF